MTMPSDADQSFVAVSRPEIAKQTVAVGSPTPNPPRNGIPEQFSAFLLLIDHYGPAQATTTWRTFGPLGDPRNNRALAMILREHADRLDPPSPVIKPGDPGYFQPAV